MKISHLWVVTKPTKNSTLEDICFQTDLREGLYHQYNGGLDPKDVIGFYTDEVEAVKEADRLLEQDFTTEDAGSACFCQHGIRPEDCDICSPDTGWM